MSQQKGKAKKRQRSWHRGTGESIRWQKAMRVLPETGIAPDPTIGTPQPVRRGAGKQHKGEAL